MTDPHDQYRPASTAELLAEAEAWEQGRLTPGGWSPADGAIPRSSDSKQVSVRLPTAMITLLKAFGAREGIGYQVLLKRWLDDRLAIERGRLRNRPSGIELPEVAQRLGSQWVDVALNEPGAVRRPAA